MIFSRGNYGRSGRKNSGTDTPKLWKKRGWNSQTVWKGKRFSSFYSSPNGPPSENTATRKAFTLSAICRFMSRWTARISGPIRDYSKLTATKTPCLWPGCLLTFFSATGQLWGDPVYDWEASRNSGYAWWFKRIEQNFRVADIVRIDHFRGFSAYWEIPAGEKTAVNGRWVDGPGADFFQALLKRFPTLPLIAEDLGTITPDVRELIHQFDFPGMKVLLFAFDESMPRNPYIPHNHVRKAVVYTGTHDNNTVRGWFENDAGEEDKRRLFSYLGREVSPSELPWEMIRMAMTSVADVAIIPMQDLLGLGQEGRMNRPSVAFGNWDWRVDRDQLTEELRSKILGITGLSGRA